MREKEQQLQGVINSLQDKTKELEQKREHWKLEYQLLKMKYEKLKGDDSIDDEDATTTDPMRERLKDVLNERVLADSKACSLILELWAHRKRLKEAERRRLRALKDLESCKVENDKLREEVGVTSAGYEGQLGLMTEHVANMNDKLSAQTDEIERLKFELKGGKKGKGKK